MKIDTNTSDLNCNNFISTINYVNTNKERDSPWKNGIYHHI